ncbi:MAG TPA: CDGSH iron-sulfur domain-containing protein [Gemmatimonadales bacterium]|nr:CDGSH iron-sulfur domain-containing protein [Gemmatimonadales bacterium]
MSDEPIPTSITWKPAGPYIVEGPVEIRDNNGDRIEPPPAKVPGQVKLCGCGLSRSRPFCDGSHRR